MIPSTEINKAAEKYRVPAETIEKDYVICWILECLSHSNLKEDFIFYGGTAIKRMHFEDHRFSEDIDLISTKTFSQEILVSELSNHLRRAEDLANLSLDAHPGRILSAGTRTQIFVEYSGFEEITGAVKEVRLDFAMGMNLYGDTEEGRLLESYSDLEGRNGMFPVMTLNTILAGKLGLLMSTTRKEPRDLYDIWFLLNRLDQFKFDMPSLRKTFKQHYGFPPTLSVLLPHLDNQLYKDRWNVRLASQITELPDASIVLNNVEEKLALLFREDASDTE